MEIYLVPIGALSGKIWRPDMFPKFLESVNKLAHRKIVFSGYFMTISFVIPQIFYINQTESA